MTVCRNPYLQGSLLAVLAIGAVHAQEPRPARAQQSKVVSWNRPGPDVPTPEVPAGTEPVHAAEPAARRSEPSDDSTAAPKIDPRRRPSPATDKVPDGPLFPRYVSSAVRSGARARSYSSAPGGRVAGSVQSRFMNQPQVPTAQEYRGGIRRSTHFFHRR